MMKAYCERCQKDVDYIVENDVQFEIEIEGIKVSYKGKRALCSNCKIEEVFVEEIEEYNQNAFEAEYWKKNYIAQCKKLDEIISNMNVVMTFDPSVESGYGCAISMHLLESEDQKLYAFLERKIEGEK